MTALTPSHPIKKDHRSYLLRLWCADTGGRCWRASLEDLRTGERIGFASLEQLFAFLMARVEGDAKGEEME